MWWVGYVVGGACGGWGVQCMYMSYSHIYMFVYQLPGTGAKLRPPVRAGVTGRPEQTGNAAVADRVQHSQKDDD